MKKSTKILSLLMAIVMLFSIVSVGASAAYADYKNASITQYNSLDKPVLTDAQQASAFLDFLDKTLAGLGIYADLGVGGLVVDARSVDSLYQSLVNLRDSTIFGAGKFFGLLGDLGDLNVDAARNVRRGTAGTTDLDVLECIFQFLEDNKTILGKLVEGTLDLGIVGGFLPASITPILSNLLGTVKGLLWGLIYPDSAAMPDGTTWDTLAQGAINDQLTYYLPSLNLSLDGQNAYQAFDAIFFAAFNDQLIPYTLNDILRPVIKGAVDANTAGGGILATLVNADYEIPAYSFDTTASFGSQLNNLVGHIAGAMLKPTYPGYIEWKFGGNNLLKENVTNLFKMLIPAGGDTNYDVENATFEEMMSYIGNSAVEQFVQHMELPDDCTNLRALATYGVMEFAFDLIPERDYKAMLKAGTLNLQTGFEMVLCDVAAYYLNNVLPDINLGYGMNFDQLAEGLIGWVEPRLHGAITLRGNTAWEKLDSLIFDVIPLNWLPEGATGSKSVLLDFVINPILDLDVAKILTILETRNDNSLYNDTFKKNIIDFVVRLIERILPGVVGQGTKDATTIEVALSPANVKTMVENLATQLNAKKRGALQMLLPLINLLIGTTDDQVAGDASVSVPRRIYNSGASANGSTVTIYNNSTGINRGYTDKDGGFHQDQLYKVQIRDLKVFINGDSNIVTANVPAGTIIDGGESFAASLTGNFGGNTAAKLVLRYDLLNEEGTPINGDTPYESTSYTYFYNNGYAEEAQATGGDIGGSGRNGHHINYQNSPLNVYTTDLASAATNYSMVCDHYYSGWLTWNGGQTLYIRNVNGIAGVTANTATFEIGKVDPAVTKNSYSSVYPFVADSAVTNALAYGKYSSTFAVGSVDSGNTPASDYGSTRTVNFYYYDDFGLPTLLDSAIGANRQEYNYDGVAEWTEYQSALINAYDVVYSLKKDTFFNAGDYASKYQPAFDRLTNAIEALENTSKNVGVQPVIDQLNAVEAPEDGYFSHLDYVLHTFLRYQATSNNAWWLVSSQTPPEDPEAAATWEAPALTNAEVNNTVNYLSHLAPRMLRREANPLQLNYAISEMEARNYVASNYTQESWDAYADALAFAKATAAEPITEGGYPALKQSKVADARVKLLYAAKHLVEAPQMADYSALDAAIESVPVDLSVYTDATANAVREALTAAQNVDRNLPASEQGVVDAAATALADAVAKLELKPNDPELVAIEGMGGVVDRTNGYVYGVQADWGYTLADCFEVLNGSMEVVLNDQYCESTGAVLQVLNNDGVVVEEYTLVVFGDINGNGMFEGDDILDIENIGNGIVDADFEWGGYLEFASDLNANFSVEGDDMLEVEFLANGLTQLTQADYAQLVYSMKG